MNLPELTTAEVIGIIAFVVILLGAIVIYMLQRRRTEHLRGQFGAAEYERTIQEAGDRRRAEARLAEREARVESFHLRALSSSDRARFIEAWNRVQARFVDGPAGAVNEADQLLGDVMSTRGYPVADFEQRANDVSVDHPAVVENYRAAHAIAVRQVNGDATTEDLRRAMIHYRALFEDLVGEPKSLNPKPVVSEAPAGYASAKPTVRARG